MFYVVFLLHGVLYIVVFMNLGLSLKRGFGGCRHGFGECDGLGVLGGFNGVGGIGGFDGLDGFDGFGGFSGLGGLSEFGGFVF